MTDRPLSAASCGPAASGLAGRGRPAGEPAPPHARACGARRWPTLAGVSVDYLVRLEQGRDDPPVGRRARRARRRACGLSEDERRHLFHLGAISTSAAMCPAAVTARARRGADGRHAARTAAPDTGVRARPGRRRAGRGTTRGLRVVGPLGVLDDPRTNLARYVFLDRARAHDAFPAWRVAADEQVGRLRRAMTRWEGDETVAELVAELRAVARVRAPLGRPPGRREAARQQADRPPDRRRPRPPVEVLAIADDSEQVLVSWLPGDEAHGGPTRRAARPAAPPASSAAA